MLLIFLCFFSIKGRAQLGFCNGNSGDPIFTETFGTGTTTTALPAGTTTYTFASTNPDDGFYTVSSNTGFFDWHNVPDHTPGDTNGKCLIVNGDFSVGEFYTIPINGLCENTSYEFSAWLINLLPQAGCGANGIPINVRFQIWDDTDTSLLASGDTGNVFGTTTPNWEQYALVFQTLPAQTSVILKMINNSAGGCGNDLAIDDLLFKSCGDTISVEDAFNNNSVTLCSSETPYATTLTAIPDNTVFTSHFYQWQESADGNSWTDITGETNQNITITGITTTMYYRAKVAEYATNLTNSDCITFSDIFQLIINQAPTQPTIACWETATFNSATCSWQVTGTQPAAPTGLACWETATFNNTTCSWDITGVQPTVPTITCWETTVFNTTTCTWDIIGTQPAAPTGLECWETAIFNNTSCLWEVTGVQPAAPTGLECWEVATFNFATCIWDISGDEPIDLIEEPQTFCEGEDTILHANTTIVSPNYLWDSGETTESIIVNTEGTYSVEITDSTCSTTIKIFYVSEVELPIIEQVTSNGNEIIIETLNIGDFEYSLDGLIYQSDNIFYNIEGGLYTVYVNERNGCGITSTEHLHFVIPKFFTPNGDGIHDTFSLKGIEYYNTSEVYIFDRFGKLLKSSKNQSFTWDGNFNNQLLPNSDYWYIVKIENQEFRGHFTLKR